MQNDLSTCGTHCNTILTSLTATSQPTSLKPREKAFAHLQVYELEINVVSFLAHSAARKRVIKIFMNAMVFAKFPVESRYGYREDPPSPPKIVGYEEGTPIKSGDFQRFTCVAIGGNPLATLRWFKRDREVRAITSISGSGVFSELVLRADASDNGATYRCEATNSATEKPLITKIKLTVHFPPSTVTIKITPSRPRSGELVSVLCDSASSNPESTLHWWRNGEVYTGYDSEVSNAVYGGQSTHSRIDFNAYSKDDEAIFTCQATNNVLQRSVHDSVTLRVFFKPEFMVASLEKFDVIEGDTLIVNLTARANPAVMSYSWRKGLVSPIPGRNAIIWVMNARLMVRCTEHFIREILYVRSASYNGVGTKCNNLGDECQANGSLYRAFYSRDSFYVRSASYNGVISCCKTVTRIKPSPIFTKETAKSGRRQRRNRPAALSGHRIKYSTRTSQIDTVTWENVLYINNVVEEDFGYYTCTGSNEMGSDSTQVLLKRRGKPDPPEDFQAQNVTSDRVLVSWSHGFDGGSPQFFRIRYMVKGSEEISNVDVLPTNATVFMITGLEPGTEYSFALMAWNVYGESGYTENEVVAQTTGAFFKYTIICNKPHV
ncbi:nephrin [Caerostris extrusa]|uniref:Nephrin n=1 Tax=Caerostris extrusa TaxID=172846 RepID=A0AAV4QJG2_CAEEX|nr:nephrin [Caerostris extrusa]